MSYWDNINEEVSQIIDFAQSETKFFDLKEVTNITLLTGLLRLSQCDAAKVLASFGLTYEVAQKTAAHYFRTVEPPGIAGRLQKAVITLTSSMFGIPLAKGANATLEFANEQAQKAGINVLPEHIMLSLLRQKEPEVMAVLSRLSIDTKALQAQLGALVEKKTDYGQIR